MNKTFRRALVFTLAFLLLGSIGVFGQAIELDLMKENFSGFSSDVATALPHAAATGLTWSDARVRGFPHFGVGLSLGAVMIPKDTFVDLAATMNIALPSEITDSELGVPFPAYAVDARLGIPFLPFDVGAKLGMLTPEMSESLGGKVNADYMLAGFEIRYPIIKGNLLLPAVSLSAGYNYLSGGIGMTVDNAGDLAGGISFDVPDDGTYTVDYTDPELRFDWQTQAVDFKVQTSKNLLIFTPYIGGAYSYGWSKAGGGVSAELTYAKDGNSVNEDDVRKALDELGYDVDLSDQGFVVLSSVDGGSIRAFGGLSVNLLLLKLDVNGQYNFTTSSLGAGVNARIQF